MEKGREEGQYRASPENRKDSYLIEYIMNQGGWGSCRR